MSSKPSLAARFFESPQKLLYGEGKSLKQQTKDELKEINKAVVQLRIEQKQLERKVTADRKDIVRRIKKGEIKNDRDPSVKQLATLQKQQRMFRQVISSMDSLATSVMLSNSVNTITDTLSRAIRILEKQNAYMHSSRLQSILTKYGQQQNTLMMKMDMVETSIDDATQILSSDGDDDGGGEEEHSLFEVLADEASHQAVSAIESMAVPSDRLSDRKYALHVEHEQEDEEAARQIELYDGGAHVAAPRPATSAPTSSAGSRHKSDGDSDDRDKRSPSPMPRPYQPLRTPAPAPGAAQRPPVRPVAGASSATSAPLKSQQVGRGPGKSERERKD